MAYKSKVFDINKNFPYNVGVRKSATYFYSAPTFFVETGDDISRYYKAIRGKNEARKDKNFAKKQGAITGRNSW